MFLPPPPSPVRSAQQPLLVILRGADSHNQEDQSEQCKDDDVVGVQAHDDDDAYGKDGKVDAECCEHCASSNLSFSARSAEEGLILFLLFVFL